MLLVPFRQTNESPVTQPAWIGKTHGKGMPFDDSGIDFDGNWGTTIVAMAGGRLVSAYFADDYKQSNGSGFGNMITIQHTVISEGVELTFFATYAHLSKNSVNDLLGTFGIAVASDEPKWNDVVDLTALNDADVNYWVSAGTKLGVTQHTGVIDTSNGDGSHIHVHFGTKLREGGSGYYTYGEKSEVNEKLLETLTFFGSQLESGDAVADDISISDIRTSHSFNSSTDGKSDIKGTSNDDTFLLGSGDETINGQGGNDTAIFTSALDDQSTFLRIGDSITVQGVDGTDRFEDVEILQFTDGIVRLVDLPDTSISVDGENIDHTYDSSLGSHAVSNDSTWSTFKMKIVDIGITVAEIANGSFWGAFIGAFKVKEASAHYEVEWENPSLLLDKSYDKIEVEGYGVFDIQDIIDAVSPDVYDDHGDTQATATSFGSGSVTSLRSTTGNVETSGDDDWFKLSLVSGGHYAFLATPSFSNNSALDPVLGLYDSSGRLLASHDDLISSLSSFIGWDASYSDDHFLKVTGYGSTTGSYNIFATRVDTDDSATDLTATDQPDDPDSPSFWDWQGTAGDDYPSKLTLEAGGNRSIDDDNRYRMHDGDDKIKAGRGNDTVWGDDDDDTLYGEEGDDVLLGGDDEDKLYGGEGNDELHGERGDDRIRGNEGDDYIHGGRGEDNLDGDDGDDYIKGGDGDDDVDGDAGNDELYGDEGNDQIDGRDGDDLLFGGEGNDKLEGDDGNDRLAGEDGNDILEGDEGDDLLFGGDGDDTLNGGTGNDLLHGEDGIDTADYSDGNDGVIINLFGETAFSTDLGSDSLYEIENILGSDGDDIIDGDHGVNSLFGDDGDDLIRGHNGNDIVDGGDDDDTVWGDAGDDTVYGGSDEDEVRGGLGNDTLFGGSGDDDLRGEQGNDSIDGGTGIDVVFSWGEREDFTFTLSGDVLTISDTRTDGLEGTDTVRNVEFFRFFDGTVAFAELFLADPIAVNDNASTDSGTPVLVDVLANDNDSGSSAINITSAEIVSGVGEVIIVDNKLVFDPRGSYPTLEIGETRTVEVDYTATTSGLKSDSARLTLTIEGTAAASLTLVGTNGNDTLDGGAGDDKLSGIEGDDTLAGHNGNDLLLGGRGKDDLKGGNKNDVLKGGSGNDDLSGGKHKDILKGGNGNDDLEGGKGHDKLVGGAGADDFIFNANQKSGRDRIVDFENGKDTLVFSGLEFSDLSISDTGSDVLIVWDLGQVKLKNIDFGLIEVSDFDFV